MRPWAADGGYFNFTEAPCDVDAILPPDVCDRLGEVKRKWDPEGRSSPTTRSPWARSEPKRLEPGARAWSASMSARVVSTLDARRSSPPPSLRCRREGLGRIERSPRCRAQSLGAIEEGLEDAERGAVSTGDVAALERTQTTGEATACARRCG